MRSQLRGDGVRSPISPPSRSSSISSIGSPSTARFALCQPPHIELGPAYVAAAAASELVSQLRAVPGREHGDISATDDNRTAIFTEDALTLLNSFLDCLVFNVLAQARSSALDPIRSAVEHIVKGRLGQQAVKSGEYELEELITEDDEAGLQNEHDPDAQWDADLVWKRTRLKIMTYMRLSEVEDGDEDEDDLEEELAHDDVRRGSRFSQRASLVATIFLTSALERIAEQCVKDAGESAYNRVALSRPGTRDGTDEDDDDVLIVTEQDVKKLTLSSMVGKLWRQWKYILPRPSPRGTSFPGRIFHERTYSSTSEAAGASSRRPSNALKPIKDNAKEPQQEPVVDASLRTLQTPKSPRPTSDQTANRPSARHKPRRSRSFGRFPVAVPGRGRTDVGSWQTGQSQSPKIESTAETQLMMRLRSSSLPPPKVRTSYLEPTGRSEDEPSSASMTEPQATNKRTSRHSQRSDTANSAASTAARTSDADVVASAGKRLSREKRRSKRISQQSQRSAVDGIHDTSGTHAPDAVVESDPIVQSTGTPPAPDDDEYDPFRADAPVPPPVKPAKSKSESDTNPAATAPPVQETLRKMSQRDSTRDSRDTSPQRTADARAGLAGGAVSTAILGTPSQRKTKKPAPLDMTATTGVSNRASRVEPADEDGNIAANESRHEIRTQVATVPAKIKTSGTKDRTSKDMSLTPTSAGRIDESRTPSSSKLQRMATPDTSSATYETPRGSPTNYGEERSSLQQPSSELNTSTVYNKSAVSKSKRVGADTGPTRPAIKTKDIPQDAGKPLSPSARSDKEFNELMSGNETVRRTLTPRQLTEIEAVDSPRLRQQQVKVAPPSPSAIQFSTRDSRASDTRESPPPELSLQRPPNSSNIRAIRQAAEAKAAEVGSATAPKPSRSGYQVKDAREQTYRMNDMADFIRSTGPTSPDQAPRLVTTASSPGKAPAAAKSSPTYQKSSMRAVVPNTSRLAQKRKTGILRPERQANDDLISFLKEGPPGAHVTKTKSMETTNSRATDMGLGAISPANRSSSQMSQSINESINSHSGLLSKHTGSSGQPERATMNTSAPRTSAIPKAVEGGLPARKQRRHKDPYAIDSDDEDEDILTGLPPKDEPGNSMSLVDFLQTTPPPDDNFPSGPKNRVGSPTPKAPMGTSSTASGGSRPLHKPIPSNEEIKKDPRSDLALPHFLKEDRQVRPRQSYDSNHSGRKSNRSAEPGRSGMRGLFKRIGVNG